MAAQFDAPKKSTTRIIQLDDGLPCRPIIMRKNGLCADNNIHQEKQTNQCVWCFEMRHT
jgi:hypothetical protein